MFIFVPNMFEFFGFFLHILLHHTTAAVVERSHHVRFHIRLEELAPRIIKHLFPIKNIEQQQLFAEKVLVLDCLGQHLGGTVFLCSATELHFFKI